MQFHDLGAQYRALKAEIDAGIAAVLEKGHFILGEQVSELEDALARDVGRRHCVTCGNGTDALVLALMLWGVGPGDAVFVPDFTYFASAGCATTVGAEMIPVDIRLDTFNLDPDALEAAVCRVKAEGRLRPAVVIPVDLFGLPADYPRILEIAARHGLRVLEDAARIDGSNAFRTYFGIMLPNARPAIVTVFMLSLVWNWNDSFTQTFLSMSRNTVAVYLTQIRGMLGTMTAEYEDPTYLYILIQAGALLCIFPLLLLFLFGQRFFTESIERTGIVG